MDVGRTIHSAKNGLRAPPVVAMTFVQFVCMAYCISYTAKFKKNVGEININQAKNDFMVIY